MTALLLFIEVWIVPLDVQIKQESIGVVEKAIVQQLDTGFTIKGYQRRRDVFHIYVGLDRIEHTVRLRRSRKPNDHGLSSKQYEAVLAAWNEWKSFYGEERTHEQNHTTGHRQSNPP